jgi:hypothetical protein
MVAGPLPIYVWSMGGAIREYIARVDRVLAAGQDLFPVAGPGTPVLNSGEPSVNNSPSGSRLSKGANAAGEKYQLDSTATAQLDQGTTIRPNMDLP